MRHLRVLLIDNRDSYTYNLFQLIASVSGAIPDVITNDDLSWLSLRALIASKYDCVVVSPGPGTPACPSDVGAVVDLFREGAAGVPVLGVCLGMQALALAHGASIERAPQPVHGRLSAVEHAGHPLLADIPSGRAFSVVRYHSLAVAEASLPTCLQPLAWTCGGHHALPACEAPGARPPSPCSGPGGERVLMALAHRELPLYGVQFHPESVATAYGDALIRNFCALVAAGLLAPRTPPSCPDVDVVELPQSAAPAPAPAVRGAEGALALHWRALPGALRMLPLGSETLFAALYGYQDDSFWLDSAATDRGRFSYMGARGGPLWRRVTYRLPAAGAPGPSNPGALELVDACGRQQRLRTTFLDWLEGELARWRVVDTRAAAALPFDFWGGCIGYLGYELKAECGGASRHAARTPDAAVFLADRLLAVDHRGGDVYVLALAEPADAEAARSWVDSTSAAVQALTLRRTRERYLADVEACLAAMCAGESYELCLTTALARRPAPDAAALYSALRRTNAAPYAAFLAFGARGPQVCCSSPERFLRGGRDGSLEARPVKGTAARGADAASDAAAAARLLASEKDRAENLMIVDLLRNDLGRVCQVGSVHVPGLIQLESIPTVHQLVSTVRGARRPDASVVQCLRATFPGGSMTGAPKLRSMDILDRLEGGPRGVYSGSIGFFSANGTFDLNIVIRTAVIYDGEVSIGAGGAVVVQSTALDEYEEMRLKARALLHAVGEVDGLPGAAPVVETEPYVGAGKGEMQSERTEWPRGFQVSTHD
ncbi:hypothetical protein WJX81_004045 [Elliptochloris bilobata]|uniref:aminodeoxychorismate synthase n=1 Tax=Elliptochloris bilobata TaxID=381761 RepID=A0AAW1RPT2_9CHLO